MVGGEVQQIVADVCFFMPPGLTLPAAWVHHDCQQAFHRHLDIPQRQAYTFTYKTALNVESAQMGYRVIAPGNNNLMACSKYDTMTC